MGEDVASKLAEMEKKLVDQARFTRTVMVVCTCAILGLNFYISTETFSLLPSTTVQAIMANLQNIVYQWNATQALMVKHPATAAK